MKLFKSVFGICNCKKVVDPDGIYATFIRQEGFVDDVYVILTLYPYGSASTEKGYTTLYLSKGVRHTTFWLPPSPKAIKAAILETIARFKVN